MEDRGAIITMCNAVAKTGISNREWEVWMVVVVVEYVADGLVQH